MFTVCAIFDTKININTGYSLPCTKACGFFLGKADERDFLVGLSLQSLPCTILQKADISKFHDFRGAWAQRRASLKFFEEKIQIPVLIAQPQVHFGDGVQ